MRRTTNRAKAGNQKSAAQNKKLEGKGKASQTSGERQEAPYPHFRRYKKSNHPTLVVGEQLNEQNKEEYKFRKVMHGARDGRHLNEKVEPNPDPTDPKPMYIAKSVRHDEKKRFDKKPLPWKYRGNKKK